MLIYGAGDAPERRVLYADIDSLGPGTEPGSLRVSVVEVLEDQEQPDTCQYQLQLSPVKDLVYVVAEHRRLRNGEEEETQPTTATPHINLWSNEVLRFATDKPGWRAAYEKLRQARGSEEADLESAQAELLALGYLVALDRNSPAELSALTRATAWGGSATQSNNLRVSTLEKNFAKKWATYWLSPKRHSQPR